MAKSDQWPRREYPVPPEMASLLPHARNALHAVQPMAVRAQKWSYESSLFTAGQYRPIGSSALFAAYFYPFCTDPCRYDTMVKLMISHTVLDNHLNTPYADPDRQLRKASVIIGQLYRVYDKLQGGQYVSAHYWKPYVLSAYAIYEQILSVYNPVQKRRFLELLTLWTDGMLAERNDLQNNRQFDCVKEFIQVRCKALSVLPSLQLIEYADSLYVPEPEWRNPKVQHLLSLLCRLFIDVLKTHDKSLPYELLYDWLGKGLSINTSTDLWRQRRRLIAPAFHRQTLDNFLPVFNDLSRVFEQQLYRSLDKESINICDLIFPLSLDIIAETGMGIKLNAQANEHRAYIDAVQHIAQHLSDNNSLSLEDIREEVDTFMFAGHDTTAVCLSWTIYFVGLYPEIQGRIHEELDTILANDCDINTENIKELQYLEAVIKESMRMRAPVPTIARTLTQDLTVGSYTLPKGISILLLLDELHRDPDIYEHPLLFNPDRWLSQKHDDDGKAANFMPFSLGARDCIGQRFAMNELKVVLGRVLHCYAFRSLEPIDKVIEYHAMVKKPKYENIAEREYPVPDSMVSTLPFARNALHGSQPMAERAHQWWHESSLFTAGQYRRVRCSDLFAAYFYPFCVDERRYDTLLRAVIAFFVLDDHLEAPYGDVKRRVPEAQAIIGQLYAVYAKLLNETGQLHVPAHTWKPYMLATYAIYNDIFSVYNDVQKRRFVHLFTAWTDGMIEECADIALKRQFNNVETFIEVRMKAIAVIPTLQLIEYADSLYVPEPEWRNPKVQHLLSLLCRLFI
ncbi:unnamed protein product, partial [Medioppia subpectinata]